MSLEILIAIELALIVVGIGFLVQGQSNSAISNVIAALLIIVGLACGMYSFSKSMSGGVPQRDIPIFDNKR